MFPYYTSNTLIIHICNRSAIFIMANKFELHACWNQNTQSDFLTFLFRLRLLYGLHVSRLVMDQFKAMSIQTEQSLVKQKKRKMKTVCKLIHCQDFCQTIHQLYCFRYIIYWSNGGLLYAYSGNFLINSQFILSPVLQFSLYLNCCALFTKLCLDWHKATIIVFTNL